MCWWSRVESSCEIENRCVCVGGVESSQLEFNKGRVYY